MRAFFAIFLLLECVASLAPSRAWAWTRTDVRGMRARAEVMPSGFARIGLEVTIEIQGGWVERFEIAGLGQGAQLDALKPPTWVKSSEALDDTDAPKGSKYVPATTLRSDGTLDLDFGTRRGAPRRGTFHSRIVYETQLVNDGSGALVLSLPTWPGAIEDVELWIDAPRGTTLVPADEAELESAQVLERGALTTLRIEKPQLPRTHALEARLLLPQASAVATAEASAPSPAADEQPDPASWCIAWLLLGLITLKRRALGPWPSGLDERLFSAAKAIALAAACAAFPFAHAFSPWAGILVLGVAAMLGACLPTALHGEALPANALYRPARAIDVQRARSARLLSWLGPGTWVDATTPSGLALIAMLGALALLAMQHSAEAGDAVWLTAWAAALPLFVLRTRLSRPLGASDALLALHQAERVLGPLAREHGAHARLEVARAAVCGHARHVRLRLNSQLSLVLTSDADGRARLAWLMTSEQGPTLRAAREPALELPALLSGEALGGDAPLAHAA